MKRTVILIVSLVLAIALSACSAKQDSLKFVKEDVSSANLRRADFEVNIGKNVGGARIVAELWQNGACTESAPLIISDETKEIHFTLYVDGFGETEGVQGLNVQIDTNEMSDSVLTYFELPTQVLGHGFEAYNINEVIEVEADTEVILAAMAFDTGAGIRTLDCRTLAADSDYFSSYSCL